MKFSKWYYIVFFAAIVISCSTPAKDDGEGELPPEEKLKKELFEEAREVHDEMMPYLDSIFKSRGVLNEELERATEGLKDVKEERKRALEEVVKELDDARESMMNWMRNYSRMPEDTVPQQEVIEKLETGLQAIEDTRTKMIQSLKKANSVLTDSL